MTSKKDGKVDAENYNIELGILDQKKILVVDDNEDAILLVKYILENNGVQVFTATSAIDAIEIIHKYLLDLLIIDIIMPYVDGFSLIRAIRSLEIKQVRETPAIALTAVDAEDERIYALQSGFQIYLTKPVDETLLLTEIVRLLRT